MRNMSFALTTQQVKDRTKSVTRRFGWAFLKPNEKVRAVEKAMGLRPGEKIQRLCVIKIISTRWEPLKMITKEDCILEGFPDMEPEEFVEMICKHYPGKNPDSEINRIEFEYV